VFLSKKLDQDMSKNALFFRKKSLQIISCSRCSDGSIRLPFW